MSNSLRYISIFVLALSGLGGCTLIASPAPRAVVVTVAPPRPVVEVRTINPGYGYMWIDGYWGWSGGQWVWSSGRWETERVGYYWVTPRYEQRGGNYYYASGGWQQNKGYKTTTPYKKQAPKQNYSSGNGSNKSNSSYNNGKGSSSNNGNGNAKGSNKSKKGYQTGKPKCPQGYVWTDNACRHKPKR